MPGTLFVVATPIGNLEDITLRALRVLRQVAVIAAEDTRRTAHLLAHHAIATATTSLYEHNEKRKAPGILTRLERGDDVALVSDAGTPAISDPGARLIRMAIAAGVRVEPIPGPSAILTALVVSGLPLDRFAFLGFPPTKGRARKDWFAQLQRIGGTIVFFESPHRVSSTLSQLRTIVGDCEVAVARELTKLHEELVIGPISLVLERITAPKGEFTVVVNLGQTTDLASEGWPESPDDWSIDQQRTSSSPLNSASARVDSRRRAVASLARAHGLTANQLYAAIESAKKSGERPT